jgi:YVTN family beta-propeller protein
VLFDSVTAAVAESSPEMILSCMHASRPTGTVLLTFCLLLSACSKEPAPPASTSTSTPPAAASTSPASGVRVYVSDETGGNVVVVDPDAGQILERIPVGKRPRGLKISRDGAQLYVALSGSPIAGPGVDESKLPPADREADGIGLVDVASGKIRHCRA